MATMEMEKMELTGEELANVTGGFIVDRGFWHDYWVVCDYDGQILHSDFFKVDAETYCDCHTVSKKVISEATYNEFMKRMKNGDPNPYFF